MLILFTMEYINDGLVDFIEDIDKLRDITRYQIAPHIYNETVAEHSFFVAVYVLKLHDFYSFDLKKALILALLHDYSEIYTSDVPYPIKKKIPELEKLLEQEEQKAYKEHCSKQIADWMVEFNNKTSPEGIVCGLADVVSVISYCLHEITLGNKDCINTYNRCKERVEILIRDLEKYKREKTSSVEVKKLLKFF